MRLRNVCFTAYDLLDFIANLDIIIASTEYLIFSLEKCPKTKTLHFQGYCELKEQLSFKQCKELMLNTTHIESRKKKQKQAIDYCQKNESHIDGPFEWGKPKKQGQRTDIEDGYQAFLNGDHTHVSTNVKYLKHFEYLQKKQIPMRTELPESHLILYDSKKISKIDIYRYVFDTIAQEKETFMWEEDTEFNGYAGQQYLLSPVMSNWEILISKYPYQVKQLYLTCQFNSPYVILYCEYGHFKNKDIRNFSSIHKI